MKPSEFYEKYWTVNGKPVKPLTNAERYLLDNAVNNEDAYMAIQFFRKRRRPLTIDVEYLKKQLDNLPDFVSQQTDNQNNHE